MTTTLDRRSLARLLYLTAMIVAASPLMAADPAESASEKSAIAREVFPIGERPAFEGKVAEQRDDGRIFLVSDSSIDMTSQLVEGWYILLTARKSDDPKIRFQSLGAGRCEIVEIEMSRIIVELPNEARDKCIVGDTAILFRSAGMTTARYRSFPAWAPLTEQRSAPESIVSSAARAVAEYRLARIGRALRAYSDKHRVLPPAVTAGPDGKPWHSWRVLILPYLGEQTLYDRYKFDQPWDGPDNKKLLNEMPDAFRDPAQVGQDGSFTHFAACVGENAAFSLVPIPAGQDGRPDENAPGHRAWRHFKDGATFCILAGSVDDGRIPWLKPEDVPLTTDLPAPGTSPSFASPHEALVGGRAVRGGVFLFGSDSGTGEVIALSTDADPNRFRAALDIRDGISPSRPDDKLPQLPTSAESAEQPILELIHDAGDVRAVLKLPAR